jgi:hypothetical protein
VILNKLKLGEKWASAQLELIRSLANIVKKEGINSAYKFQKSELKKLPKKVNWLIKRNGVRLAAKMAGKSTKQNHNYLAKLSGDKLLYCMQYAVVSEKLEINYAHFNPNIDDEEKLIKIVKFNNKFLKGITNVAMVAAVEMGKCLAKLHTKSAIKKNFYQMCKKEFGFGDTTVKKLILIARVYNKGNLLRLCFGIELAAKIATSVDCALTGTDNDLFRKYWWEGENVKLPKPDNGNYEQCKNVSYHLSLEAETVSFQYNVKPITQEMGSLGIPKGEAMEIGESNQPGSYRSELNFTPSSNQFIAQN